MELLALFLASLSGLAGVIFAVVIAQDVVTRHTEGSNETARRSERLERLRRWAEISPDDAVAWDRYGDACRENDLPEEAIRAWQRASAISCDTPGSSDWGHKIAMATRDMEIARANQAPLATRLAGRPQVCRSCGYVAPPGVSDCPRCGALVPVDTLAQFWRHPLWRRIFRDDIVGLAIRVGVGLLAILGAQWIPWEIRGALLIALVLVVPFWWLRRFGQGT